MSLVKDKCNNKIWSFINYDIDETVIKEYTKRQLTLMLQRQLQSHKFMVTLVYVKCNFEDRLRLWEDIYHLSADIDLP